MSAALFRVVHVHPGEAVALEQPQQVDRLDEVEQLPDPAPRVRGPERSASRSPAASARGDRTATVARSARYRVAGCPCSTRVPATSARVAAGNGARGSAGRTE